MVDTKYIHQARNIKNVVNPNKTIDLNGEIEILPKMKEAMETSIKKKNVLTPKEVEFIVLNFFEDTHHDDWKSIARTIISNGACIVPGDGEIWIGGIGNFIEKENPDDLIGCTRLKFNYDQFFYSDYYKEIVGISSSKLKEQLSLISDELNMIDNLILKIIKCVDRNRDEIKAGDYLDVQNAGPHQVYCRDGLLYFKPYGKEELVSSYFSNDIIICDINKNINL